MTISLAEHEGELNPDSRWALTWFEPMGLQEGEFSEAEKLSNPNTRNVRGLAEAGTGCDVRRRGPHRAAGRRALGQAIQA